MERITEAAGGNQLLIEDLSGNEDDEISPIFFKVLHLEDERPVEYVPDDVKS